MKLSKLVLLFIFCLQTPIIAVRGRIALAGTLTTAGVCTFAVCNMSHLKYKSLHTEPAKKCAIAAACIATSAVAFALHRSTPQARITRAAQLVTKFNQHPLLQRSVNDPIFYNGVTKGSIDKWTHTEKGAALIELQKLEAEIENSNVSNLLEKAVKDIEFNFNERNMSHHSYPNYILFKSYRYVKQGLDQVYSEIERTRRLAESKTQKD